MKFRAALKDRPYRFGFFQALRRMECVHADKPRLGTSTRAGDEPVRLGQEASLAFAPSTVASFEEGRQGLPPRLNVFFLGLFGPNGPLPHHLTEYARDRKRNHDDPTFSRFADVFHHRLLSMFYRAWANAQPTVQHDRRHGADDGRRENPAEDRFALYVGALFGLGLPALRDRDAMPDYAKRYYAGALANHRRGPQGLRSMLAGFYGVRTRIEEFIGKWVALPAESHSRLGASPRTGRLGRSVILGERIWDCNQKFRIHLGPLSLEEYERFLPGGESLPRLKAILRNYVGDAFTWDLRLHLRAEEVPPVELGRYGRLGLTTWVQSGPGTEDRSDLLVESPA